MDTKTYLLIPQEDWEFVKMLAGHVSLTHPDDIKRLKKLEKKKYQKTEHPF